MSTGGSRRPAERRQAPAPDAAPTGEGDGRPCAGGTAEAGGRGEAAARAGERAAASAGPEAARRRAGRRAERISAGATELEHRLADLLRGGLADMERPAGEAGRGVWEETAARMVDAQAPGLAARVRELGAVPGSGPGWPSRLLEECALLHLLDQGFLNIGGLPEPLAATVRSRVGITTRAAEVLAGRDAVVRDHWLVLGRHDTEEGRVVARRVWLHGRRTGHTALVLSFAAGRLPEPPLAVGVSVDADLAYYPGAPALRAALGERHSEPGPGGRPPGAGVHDALASYGAALCGDPWLEGLPVVLAGVVPVPVGDGWQLADEGGSALPVARTAGVRSRMWRLAAVSGGEPVTVFGECGHRGFTPYTVWPGPEAVPGAGPGSEPGSESGSGPAAAVPLTSPDVPGGAW
ncbi:SWIM zinc finger family protein [Streptomyces mangrovi]|uniref:SWIM zinc finger family protein n=1 Tax=Streptomyces mangrovi TaxID=1206892 RepID=UPI00399CBA80